jgi:hypothetical protein
MQPRHQGYTLGEAGGNHVANCATDTGHGPNRARFALRVSKSRRPSWANVSLCTSIGEFFEHRFTFGATASGTLAA